MKAHIRNTIPAMGIQRITRALMTHAPEGLEFTEDRAEADLVIHLIVGVENFGSVPIDALIQEDVDAGRDYAMIQCCFATTEKPSVEFWAPLWAGANAVWSYLDLPVPPALRSETSFVRAPLGVDPGFRRREREKDVLLVTSGYVAESEGILEASQACRNADGWHIHIGPDLGFGDHVTAVMGLADERLATIYSRALFVSGLRVGEGFELPAAEGLVCGARPILFDNPCYRHWYERWGVFVPEQTGEPLVRVLTSIFRAEQDRLRVLPEESADAAQMFDWRVLVPAFWQDVQARSQRRIAAVAR